MRYLVRILLSPLISAIVEGYGVSRLLWLPFLIFPNWHAFIIKWGEAQGPVQALTVGEPRATQLRNVLESESHGSGPAFGVEDKWKG